MSRSFTIVKIEKSCGSLDYIEGRFMGERPSQVAKKVFSHAYRECKGKCNSFKITIRETTMCSLKKEYSYRVTKKNKTVEVERGGKTIIYHFTTKVKSLNYC